MYFHRVFEAQQQPTAASDNAVRLAQALNKAPKPEDGRTAALRSLLTDATRQKIDAAIKASEKQTTAEPQTVANRRRLKPKS